MKTFLPKAEDQSRAWYLVDGADQPMGRLAVRIARTLRGKDQPSFAPHVDTGSFVVVVNADKIKLTGRKEEQKIYHRFSGYPGGLKKFTAAELRKRHPDWPIRLAVRGMMPKNTLSRTQLRRLKVYAGGEHPHAAQKLVALGAR